MDVGCEESGVCYAEAHDRPYMCPKAYSELVNEESKVEGWRLIKTAPKSLPPGQGVLIYRNGLVCHARPTESGGWELMNNDFFTWQYPLDNPTHWMPLPESP